MFLDASAIIAILANEEDGPALAARLGQARVVYTSPLAVFEASLGLARIGNAPFPGVEALLTRFLAEVAAVMVPITERAAREAIRAFERFGKGRHPAALNMGDCFAYACAREVGVPLLIKGSDFPHTDIEVA